MRADLHVHSTASDGTLSPAELVSSALESGLTHLALTDHDSVDGIGEAVQAAAGTGLTVLAGVELSAVTPDGRDVHILGYALDPFDQTLLAHLEDLRAARIRRARYMVEALSRAGLSIDLDGVLALSSGGAVGRSHVARALVNAGHACSIHDAFERLIGRGRPYYVAKDVRSPHYAAATIRSAGGLVFIAHPGVSGLSGIARSLASEGCLDGVEVHHADHTAEQVRELARLATDLGLLMSGGSDYHGPQSPNPALGSVPIPEEVLSAFLAAVEGRSATE